MFASILHVYTIEPLVEGKTAKGFTTKHVTYAPPSRSHGFVTDYDVLSLPPEHPRVFHTASG